MRHCLAGEPVHERRRTLLGREVGDLPDELLERREGGGEDRYYGDPTVTPNPNLRPLSGGLYAVRVVLSDLGTCGGLTVDERARVLAEDGTALEDLYAVGNTAANAFSHRYPGATIGQGLVVGYVAA